MKENSKSREYKLWYEGNINDILYYYKTTIDVKGKNLSMFTPSFMRVAPVGLTTNIGGGYQINNFHNLPQPCSQYHFKSNVKSLILDSSRSFIRYK